MPKEQLYDLLLDPAEARNHADDPDHADALEEMSERLDDWMERTEDPLLDGRIGAPPGAEYNLPEQGSSREPRTFEPRRRRSSGAARRARR
ncbi:MAG TPA: hypothetical protein VE523_09665 [Solirubrobacterales bacterium]|nr:hypothetical protein [Solirubrobacterales bacterium]